MAQFTWLPRSACSLIFLTHPPIPLSCLAHVLKCENGAGTLNSKIIMLKAHFIFFHLNTNYSAGDSLCFCYRVDFSFFFFSFSLSLFYLSPLGKYFFDCLHSLFCGNKSLLFYQEKKKKKEKKRPLQ